VLFRSCNTDRHTSEFLENRQNTFRLINFATFAHTF